MLATPKVKLVCVTMFAASPNIESSEAKVTNHLLQSVFIFLSSLTLDVDNSIPNKRSLGETRSVEVTCDDELGMPRHASNSVSER